MVYRRERSGRRKRTPVMISATPNAMATNGPRGPSGSVPIAAQQVEQAQRRGDHEQQTGRVADLLAHQQHDRTDQATDAGDDSGDRDEHAREAEPEAR